MAVNPAYILFAPTIYIFLASISMLQFSLVLNGLHSLSLKLRSFPALEPLEPLLAAVIRNMEKTFGWAAPSTGRPAAPAAWRAVLWLRHRWRPQRRRPGRGCGCGCPGARAPLRHRRPRSWAPPPSSARSPAPTPGPWPLLPLPPPGSDCLVDPGRHRGALLLGPGPTYHAPPLPLCRPLHKYSPNPTQLLLVALLLAVIAHRR
jgi:hypothetical protein